MWLSIWLVIRPRGSCHVISGRVSSLFWNVLWLEASWYDGMMVWWEWLSGGLWKECSNNDCHVPAQVLRAGPGQPPGGRKEEKHKGGTDAAMLRQLRWCSLVSSLRPASACDWQMTQLCRGCQQRAGAGQWSRVSYGALCHVTTRGAPALFYIKHRELYPVERSLDYQFPFG